MAWTRRDRAFLFKKYFLFSQPTVQLSDGASLLGRDGDVNCVAAAAVNEVVHLLHPGLVPRHDAAKNGGLGAVLEPPKGATALAGRPRDLSEALVQGEVVTNGVLPVARPVHFVVRMLLGHGSVDFRQRQHPLLRGHQGLGDQLRVRKFGLGVDVGQLDNVIFRRVGRQPVGSGQEEALLADDGAAVAEAVLLLEVVVVDGADVFELMQVPLQTISTVSILFRVFWVLA